MKKYLILLLVINLSFMGFSQEKGPVDSSWKETPRYTPTRINNLVHTKLDVRFDYEKTSLLGKAWITLTPHFNPTAALTLDAKGMDILQVSMVQPDKSMKTLEYSYDRKQLSIKLPRTYKKGENYTVYINYVSKPNEYQKETGADPMLGVKGLYFINPKGEEKNKPIQIWTQGETESNSVWFPTIDQTQQKTTQELYMTVPSKYVTLSNGKLVSQKINTDGTRTDYWKMDLPHSPYLFFMGVGDYAVIKDSWKGKEVNYYVEKEFGPVAKKIFGNTPEMMTYFSKITGVEYPWVKYSQITGREYVAGAMENTTATIHQETAQQDARELTDGNIWEGTIAHELFHQWFGDYVTAESWSNLTLNESFADYSQTLWDEYKYGKDAGDAENFSGLQGYLMGDNAKKDLVRFYYEDREQMFDGVSYQKGGRILHMLRKYIGDSAFFKGLNLYLSNNKFKAAEAHHLRLAFEEVSGMDLTWYFNQWYFGNGHPKLDIQYKYNEATKQATVVVKQTQATGKIFKIPTFIDVYNGKTRTRNQVWIEHAVDSFSFASNTKPDLINFDGEKILLCEKKENKSLDNYIHQFYHAGNYLDRKEAVEFCGKKTDDPKALAVLKDALNDPYHGIRLLAMGKIDMKKDRIRKTFEETLALLVNKETNRPVKASMIEGLGKTADAKYTSLYEKNINDSSYSVSGASLEALSKIDSVLALKHAMELSNKPAKGKLDNAINSILVASGKEEVFDKLADKFTALGLTNEKFMLMQQIGEMTGSMKSNERIKKSIDLITAFRDEIPAQVKEQTNPYINGMILGGIMNKLKMAGNTEMVKYLESKLGK
ncbi:MAG: M1 family aminopeptidase [bacterium]|jgi:aminopeptidase N|nr:M1 family peptidase [Chitinophagaceae bacterium]